MKPTPTPAKITPPQVQRVLPRPRLFRRLDQGRKRSVIWVMGPPGAGKTTLVSSYLEARELRGLWYQIDAGDGDPASFFYYLGLALKQAAPRYRQALPALTPEYLPGLEVFTRRYFETLAARLKSPCVLVFDNYQEAPADGPLPDILRTGVAALPRGFTTIIISRAEPLPAFARLRTHEAMTIIDANELKLTPEEGRALARRRHSTLKGQALTQVQEQTQGWTAGLLLALEQKTPTDASPPAGSPQAMFDYFAHEIFGKTDPDTQKVLLLTALLPQVSAAMAEQLTGRPDATECLETLARNNFFTSKHPGKAGVYEYHPLFREFLQARARATLTSTCLSGVQQQAAALLEQAGAIEDAVVLLQAAHDWTALTRIAVQQAPALLAQGRWQTLQAWLTALPAEWREQAWPQYWAGMCRLLVAPHEAWGNFEKAFMQFEAEGNALGKWLAWSEVVDACNYCWDDFMRLDPWLARLDDLFQRYPEFPSIEIEMHVAASAFSAMFWRQPGHPRLPLLEARLQALFPKTADKDLRTLTAMSLLHYYIWIGDLAKAQPLVNTMRSILRAQDASPLTVWWRALEAVYCWTTGAFEDCMNVAAEGLELGRTLGIHLFDLALLLQRCYGFLHMGDLGAAADVLRRAQPLIHPARRLDIAHYHFVAGWLAAREGDLVAATQHAQTSLTLNEQLGPVYPWALSHHAMAQVSLVRADYPVARAHLSEARRLGREINSVWMESMVLHAEAYLTLHEGDETQTLTLLADALRLGRERGFVANPWWLPAVMVPLFAKALAAGIEVDYVKQLIRQFKLAPPAPSADLEHWPWPIKIYTLGRLGVVIEGQRLRFERKAQRRPLELLMALISFGGREVSESRLSEILWDNAEADAARVAFKSALSRLRKLLGDEVVLLRDNRLSLNPDKVWVDAWAFERLAAQIESADAAAPEAERVLALYQGPFLGDADAAPWALPTRERLRAKLLHVLIQASRRRLQDGRPAEALRLIEKGLEADPLAEELYGSLIRAHAALGQRGAALTAYQRCQQMLSTQLGIDPSPRTQALYQAVRDNQPLPA